MVSLEIIDENGNLKVPLALLYALLRRGAKMKGRYLEVEPSKLMELSTGVSPEEMVPEVLFCPSGEPQPIDVDPDDVLAQVCTDVYRYFPGDETSKCAACAVKVYSTLGDTWFVDEEGLMKILEIAREENLPIEWSKGNVVYTTCPPDYRDAVGYPPGSYREGLERLRKALRKLLGVVA